MLEGADGSGIGVTDDDRGLGRIGGFGQPEDPVQGLIIAIAVDEQVPFREGNARLPGGFACPAPGRRPAVDKKETLFLERLHDDDHFLLVLREKGSHVAVGPPGIGHVPGVPFQPVSDFIVLHARQEDHRSRVGFCFRAGFEGRWRITSRPSL